MNGDFRKGDLIWYIKWGHYGDKDYRICPGIYVEDCRVLGASGYTENLYRLSAIYNTIEKAQEDVDVPF